MDCAASFWRNSSALPRGATVGAAPSVTGLADAMGIFYNLTGDVACFDPMTQPPWAAVRPLCGLMLQGAAEPASPHRHRSYGTRPQETVALGRTVGSLHVTEAAECTDL